LNAGNLSDRLKSLGVQLGAAAVLKKKPSVFPIETVLDGELETTPQGEVFTIHKVFRPGFRHGQILLEPDFQFPLLSRWAKIPRTENMTPFDLLFLDTETTGLAGGAGTQVFMVGLGYFQHDGFHLVQLFLKTPSDAAAFLQRLETIVCQFKAISTYNGKSFDVPVLNSQCILNHLPSYLKSKYHFDLLPLARRLWSNRLPNRSLKDIETQILNVSRSSEEIPGWMIPEMYADYLRSGDSRPLTGIFYHNEIDILSLAAMFAHTARILFSPIERTDIPLVDVFSIARLFEDLGEEDLSYTLFDHCFRRGIEDEFLSKVVNHLAFHHRRREEWNQAVDFWKVAAELDDISACIELAKYFEHVVRDYQSALYWTHKAKLMRGRFFRHNQTEEQIQHRLKRLEKRGSEGKKAES
jgi:uncharacterized protein YprB with RNaseH-like and TPR domain